MSRSTMVPAKNTLAVEYRTRDFDPKEWPVSTLIAVECDRCECLWDREFLEMTEYIATMRCR